MNLAAIFLALTTLSSFSYGSASAPSGKTPSIALVQQKAIEHARIDPSEISQWKKKARVSALLPKLQVEYDRRVRYDVNVDVSDSVYVGSSGATVGPEQGSFASNQNADQNVSVKAVWSFSEALFNPDLLAVSEETRLLARERQAILAEVNKNYYERERIEGEIKFLEEKQKRGTHSEKLRQEIFAKGIAFNEATAALDALTGGWFGEEIRTSAGEREGR